MDRTSASLVIALVAAFFYVMLGTVIPGALDWAYEFFGYRGIPGSGWFSWACSELNSALSGNLLQVSIFLASVVVISYLIIAKYKAANAE